MKPRPWAIWVLLVGLVLGANVALLVSPVEASEGDGPGALPADSELVPDVVVSVSAAPTADERAAALLVALRRSPTVAWAADDAVVPGRHRIVVAFAEEGDEAGLRVVRQAIAANDVPATVSGRAITDGALADTIRSGVIAAVVLASMVVAALVSWLTGVRRGVLGGLLVAAAAWLGGTIGASAGGPFDGSIATTSVPPVLGATVVATYVLIRLLLWFRAPVGEDQADMIRRSVAAIGMELVLFFAGLAAVVVFLEWMAPSRSVGTVVLVAGLTAALLALATVPPALAAFEPSGESRGPLTEIDAGGARRDWSPLPAPTGREYPIAVLAGFVAMLIVVAVFSFRTTSASELLDERALPDGSPSVVGTRDLLAEGGDPTSAILAVFPLGTDQQEKSAWLEQVSRLESVARVDAPTGRARDGELTPIDGLVGDRSAALDPEAPRFALVVPEVTGRSEGALELVDAIRAADGSVEARLGGVPAAADDAAGRDRSMIWSTIIALGIVGGVAVFVLLGDLWLAGLAAGLRLLELAAVSGVYQLLVTDPTGAEIQLAVFIVAVGAGLFELGYLRRLLQSHRTEDVDDLRHRALEQEGAAASVALGMAGVAAFGLVFADLALMRRLGILLVVVIGIEIVIGFWLLRPVILGTRAIRHFAAEPVRRALRALDGTRSVSGTEHQAWVDVVGGLLWAEFALQSDPPTASVDSVFVPDTPVHRKAVDHHASLAQAELRVVGHPPQLRTLRVVGNTSPAAIAVTVDHPVRHLVGGDGRIVGVRRAERRSVMLWLAPQADGSYRIVDSVELGAVPLGVDPQPVAVAAPVPSPIN